MAISSTSFFMLVLVSVLVLVWFQVNSLGNKIFCTFRSKDKGKDEKFVGEKDGVVHFKGGVYEIDPRRVTILKYKRGLIGMLFQIPVKTLDFTWSSRVAENPDDFSTTWDTPDARGMADSRKDWIGMNSVIDVQTGKKPNFMGNWMVWAGVIIIVVIAFVTYINYTNVKSIQKYLEASGNPNAVTQTK